MLVCLVNFELDQVSQKISWACIELSVRASARKEIGMVGSCDTSELGVWMREARADQPCWLQEPLVRYCCKRSSMIAGPTWKPLQSSMKPPHSRPPLASNQRSLQYVSMLSVSFEKDTWNIFVRQHVYCFREGEVLAVLVGVFLWGWDGEGRGFVADCNNRTNELLFQHFSEIWPVKLCNIGLWAFRPWD